jgi:hypothetical protein
MPAFENLDEYFSNLDNYHGGWDAYRQNFLKESPQVRVGELAAFDKLLAEEYRPTRQTAEYITKRRELGDLHDLLTRAQR